MTTQIRLGNRETAKHSYEIETTNEHGKTMYITVDANNRDQAARIAERNGFDVWSVNMVG